MLVTTLPNNVRLLDDLGRVAIPKLLREMLSWRPGDYLKVTLCSEPGEVLIRKVYSKGGEPSGSDATTG